MTAAPKTTDPTPTSNAAGIGSSDLFADYDRAAERLAEARRILAIDPMHKPAQERVEQMLGVVVFEIGRFLEKTRSPNGMDEGLRTQDLANTTSNL